MKQLLSLSKLRSAAVLFLATAIVLPLSGCSKSSEERPDVIKIVSSFPRTGSARAQTDTIVNGIKMAFEDVDYKIGDWKIEYEDMDDSTAAQGDWTTEAETRNANAAVRDPNVMAYIGTYNSGAAKVAMPILNQADLMMISPANTSVELTKADLGAPGETEGYRPSGKISYFRVIPTDDMQGAAGADWAKEMGVKSVFVLHDNQVYGKGLADYFRERCEEIGIEVLGSEGIDNRIQDFKPLMLNIRNRNPDLVYFGGTTQSRAGQVAKDLVAAGLDAKLMVPDGCHEHAFIVAAGAENLNGRVYITFGGLPPDQLTGKAAEFVERYRQKHGGDPEAYAIYGYESAKVVLESIRRAGVKDRSAITEAARKLTDFDGTLGVFSFDQNGDTTLRNISGNTVEDGKFKFVKVLQSDSDETNAQ